MRRPRYYVVRVCFVWKGVAKGRRDAIMQAAKPIRAEEKIEYEIIGEKPATDLEIRKWRKN